MPTPRITVAICTYQRYDFLDTAINGALAQDLDAAVYDILVVDNTPPSPERTASHAKWQSEPRVRYITVDTPGLSNARNVSLRESTAPYIAFLDDDAVPVRGWLSALLSAFEESSPTPVVVGGKVLPDFAIPRPPWLHDKLLDYLSVLDLPGDATRPLEPREWPVGANIAFAREATLAAGGFDVNLGRTGNTHLLSGEESRMMQIFRLRGEPMMYAPQAIVHHHIPASRLTPAFFRRRVAWQAVTFELQNTPFPPQAQAMAWKVVLDYVQALPPGIPLMGLFADTNDANVFMLQLKCYEVLLRIMLTQGELPDFLIKKPA